jgi:enoyl-CoA hydratase/carnithine racemase
MSSSLIDIEEHGSIAIVRLHNPPVNALDREVLLAITETFGELSDARAVVLTGAGSAFSAGADLFRVLNPSGLPRSLQ